MRPILFLPVMFIVDVILNQGQNDSSIDIEIERLTAILSNLI